jgi:Zn-dependent protease
VAGEPTPPRVSATQHVTYPLDLGSITGMVEYRFMVLDRYVDVNGLATYIVMEEPMKQKFQELLRDLANHNLVATIRKVSNKLAISIFPKPNLKKPRRKINLILFLATIGSVFFASYVLNFIIAPQMMSAIFGSASLWPQVIILALSILGIIVLHEMGHVLVVRHHKMDATLPYFVPAPPPIGTFGAVISLRGPPGNRDQLFDLGFSGPIAGFLASIAVAIFAYLTAPIITDQQAAKLVAAGVLSISGWPSSPLFVEWLGGLGLRSPPTGYTLVLIIFAADFGALITFLNLLPVWQLDGGHIARATFGDRGHKIFALIGFGILILAGYFGSANYYGFAVLLLVFMIFSRRPLEGVEPLDDVSPLSTTRKLLFVSSLAMLVLTFVIL